MKFDDLKKLKSSSKLVIREGNVFNIVDDKELYNAKIDRNLVSSNVKIEKEKAFKA